MKTKEVDISEVSININKFTVKGLKTARKSRGFEYFSQWKANRPWFYYRLVTGLHL